MTAVFPEAVPPPAVPLSPGMRAGDFLFVSGQVARRRRTAASTVATSTGR